jgi:hypothetical protein
LSLIRGRLPLEVHNAVFIWVLKLAEEKGLIDGKTVGVDTRRQIESVGAPKMQRPCSAGLFAVESFAKDVCSSVESASGFDPCGRDSADSWTHGLQRMRAVGL